MDDCRHGLPARVHASLVVVGYAALSAVPTVVSLWVLYRVNWA